MKLFVTAFFSLFSIVVGHAVVTKPIPRALGPAALDACGLSVYNVLKSDKYGPIENAANKEESSYNAAACHLFFCRGYQFADNTNNVATYPAGAIVDFHVDIEAHHTGTANVSLVDLASQTTFGSMLFYWPVYANDTLGPIDWPKNETDFSATIPDVGTRCANPGACAIQWWWYAYNNQTYESCIDFVQ
ncbi:hypothetical protein AMATHDRAFT_150314 [Amanita thiersii Skay4041]|uniref:Uncharacterized protein n=1 Tax=Amanita thiersii Skay4041 TaxID=703135 RepID=A0A2A9NJ29_9AGAR|nr:hypothetical protein AMATHDRAFT_150314 [Amanita thiersii Skay4041]